MRILLYAKRKMLFKCNGIFSKNFMDLSRELYAIKRKYYIVSQTF